MVIRMFQNYPNPFNASTMIRYELPGQSNVTIDISDILGRKIITLQDGLKPAGHHQVQWNAQDVSSRVYFFNVQTENHAEIKKMLLLK